MEEKTDMVTSELFSMINATYSGKKSWKQLLSDEALIKKEDLSLVRSVSHRSCGFKIKSFVPFIIAGIVFMFMLSITMFAYNCVNNTHCSYEFDDNYFLLSPVTWLCNYLGRKSMN